MKRTLRVILIALLTLFVLSGCSSSKEKLYVFNVGDYMDMDVIKDFEEEFDCKVIYEEYASNEDLFVKIKTSKQAYDVIFPSDYMLERLVSHDLVQKLDKEKIENYKYIDEYYLNRDFDPNNDFSLPYMAGTVGIVYNAEKYPEGIDEWADLWDEKYERDVVLYYSQRDVLMVALKKLGYSMNTQNPDELEAAKAELIKQKPLIYGYLGDEIKDILVAEDANIGVVYSGDAGIITSLNDDFKYALPKEGTNLWIDLMAIPKSSQNPELAHEFINFLLRPDIQARNAEYLQYSTISSEAKEMLPDEIKNNPALYPPEEDLKNTEVFTDPTEVIELYDRIWTEVLSGL
ncbi:ABC transporter substrate-binding protein [Ezakiella peruensis]|uniref:ABC transporter substrate-binding protein n=1 Tax=Ezakiella peruensis TaxID=1464038 RepID=UPI000C1B480A|nr:spermidine/putrescine ABC transporter substrate-binding protein [Ezakiella peruensis]